MQVDGSYDLPEEEEDESSENNDSTISDNGVINSDFQFNETCARFLLTNARSIMPKIKSLQDAFQSLNLHFACVTETWYAGSRELRDHIVDVQGESGIIILQKSRDGRVKRRGGGVTIACNTALCNFKPRQLKIMAKDHKVLCAVGKIGKIERKFVVFVTYIPPGTRAGRVQQLRETLAAEVAEAKLAFKDPVFIITGDFNHHDISGEVNLAEQVAQVPSGPTRGGNTIDLVYTNTKREGDFAADLRNWNWEELRGCDSVDDMWGQLEGVIDKLTECHFPLVRVRKRSNESPWITWGIRRLWKKKIRVYKKEGKSQNWWDVDRVLQEKIDKSRAEFVEKILDEGNSGRSFYTTTKSLAKAAVVPQWTVKDLFVGRQPQEVCQEVLSYFGGVASGPPPDLTGVARGSGGLPEFTIPRTVKLLESVKKTDSRVDGDPLPHLVRCHAAAFAGPVSIIFNATNWTGVWPSKWKTEHITVIPKNPSPAGLSECRNISCTSIFSKVMEGEVMRQLRKELLPDPSQYGGIPSCIVEYMLVDLWERILDALEGGTRAAVLLGINYEKALNRMRHDVCLAQLKELGALPGSLSLVRAFLQGRSMTICVDGHHRGKPSGKCPRMPSILCHD